MYETISELLAELLADRQVAEQQIQAAEEAKRVVISEDIDSGSVSTLLDLKITALGELDAEQERDRGDLEALKQEIAALKTKGSFIKIAV